MSAALMVGSVLVGIAGPASAASPAAGVAGFECQVTLPVWPTASGGSASCNGLAVGGGVHGAAPVTAAGTSFTGQVTSYNEACVAGEPPLIGTATGNAIIGTSGGNMTAGFSWTRVGLTAVVTTSGPSIGGHSHNGAGAAIAGFVPLVTGGIPTCAQPGSLTAIVAGGAALAGL
jgi:hypothetical protein